MEAFVCVGGVCSLFLLLAFLLAWRYINYRETMALAEKGLVKPERQPQRNGTGKMATLRWGIIIAGIGLALTLGMWPLGFGFGSNRFPLGMGPWMLFGFLPLFFGLSLIFIYLVAADKNPKDEQPPVVPPVEAPKPVQPVNTWTVAEAQPEAEAGSQPVEIAGQPSSEEPKES